MIRQEKASIGHHIKDLVKECTFRGVDCLASLGGEDSLMTYSRFLTPKFGNCFTIYAEQEMLGRSSMTGAAYGLSLVLNIEQETYLRGGATSMVILLSLYLHNVYFDIETFGKLQLLLSFPIDDDKVYLHLRKRFSFSEYCSREYRCTIG